MVSSTAFFTKAERFHLQITLISILVPPQAKRSSPCPHLLMHYFTFRAQPTRAVVPQSRSASRANQTDLPDLLLNFFHRNSKVFFTFELFIYLIVGNSKVFRIFYIESRIGDEKFAFLFFFSLFLSLFDVWVFASDLTISTRGDGFSTRGKFASLFFFSLFDVWVFASDLTVTTCGDGFSTRGDEVCISGFFFFLYLMFGFSHLIWSIETPSDGFSTRGEFVCFSIFIFSYFFFVWCLGFRIWFVPFWCSWWWVFILWWWSLHLLHLGF